MGRATTYRHSNVWAINIAVLILECIKIPLRVKVPLTIYDNTFLNRRDIWFGIRPGATYGIWGVDPKATNVDFSEGEFEIPPQTSVYSTLVFRILTAVLLILEPVRGLT